MLKTPPLEPAAIADPVLEESVSFPSGDATLQGQLFRPASAPPRAVVVLNGATGVPQRAYAAFVRWLVQSRQVACLTYDYRDFASSAQAPQKTSRATMLDWGLHDATAARTTAMGLVPDVPVWVIGQSLGALLIPFQPGAERIDRVIAVSSGPVHLSDHPARTRLLAMLNWWVLGPLSTWIKGSYSGRIMGLGDDLPATVFHQWRRWCTTQGFFDNEIGKGIPNPTTPMRARARFVSASDDTLVPTKVAWRLIPYYRGCKVDRVVLRPENYGLARIGHIGPLRKEAAPVWEDVIGP